MTPAQKMKSNMEGFEGILGRHFQSILYVHCQLCFHEKSASNFTLPNTTGFCGLVFPPVVTLDQRMASTGYLGESILKICYILHSSIISKLILLGPALQ